MKTFLSIELSFLLVSKFDKYCPVPKSGIVKGMSIQISFNPGRDPECCRELIDSHGRNMHRLKSLTLAGIT